MLDTHAKVWLWIVFIANILAALFYVRLSVIADIFIAYFILSLLLIAAVSLMLFKFRKIGFYLLCCIAVIAFLLNVYMQGNILIAICGLVLNPLITYLFIKSSWDLLL